MQERPGPVCAVAVDRNLWPGIPARNAQPVGGARAGIQSSHLGFDQPRTSPIAKSHPEGNSVVALRMQGVRSRTFGEAVVRLIRPQGPQL